MKKIISILIAIFIIGGELSAQNCSAAFTFTQAPNTLIVSFTDITSPVSAIKQWSFGDNQVGSGGNPIHQYSVPGFYVVCLNIIDSLTNCQASYCDTIFVASGSQTCAASFTFSIGANGVVSFTNTSLPSTSGYSFLWDFGDNQTSTQVNPTHTYTSTGSFVVFLTMTGGNCNSGYVDTVSVIPNGQPCAALFNILASSGNYIQFNNASLPSLIGYSFQWDFGDNQTSNSIAASHTYSAPGAYVVCLTMSDTINCQSTFCDTIQVSGNPPPCTANFTWVQTTGNTIQFTNTSLPSTAGYNFSWSYGDSQTGSSISPSHTYTSGGNYTVCLTMFDSTCQSTFCDSIYVNPLNGVQEVVNTTWSLYPNPASDQLNIQASEILNGKNYRILDIAGRTVDADVLSSSQLNIQSLEKGVYLLQIMNESGNYSTQRFVKQ